jgi:hypothetical protein
MMTRREDMIEPMEPNLAQFVLIFWIGHIDLPIMMLSARGDTRRCIMVIAVQQMPSVTCVPLVLRV